MLHRIFAFLAVATLLLAPPLAAQEFPELTGRVVDAADIISPEQEAALASKLEALETQSERQFVIATIPDLQGYDIADYGYQLGREWGIGDAERNDGVLLIVAPNDRKTRIEVGYGVEPVLTDGYSTLIIQKQMLPLFRQGDFAGGIDVATDSIISQLVLPEAEALAIAKKATSRPKSKKKSGIDFPTIIFLALFFFFIVVPMLSGKGGKRYRRGGAGSAVGNIILWEVGSAVLRGAAGGGSSGGGWGGGGGGGFGGGGFSGGGGSFGGGGASGGW